MKPTYEQIQNARQLALTLEKVAVEYPEHFDMSTWVQLSENVLIDPDSRLEDLVRPHLEGQHPVDCGTAGCALGWAPYATGVPASDHVHVRSFGNRNTDWRDYSVAVLGIGGWWFDYIFLTNTNDFGEDAARDAAARLREWIDEHDVGADDGSGG